MIHGSKTQLKQPLMAQYHKTTELSVASIFKLRAEELELFFRREHQKLPDNDGERRECLIILQKVEWIEGLLKSLATDAETGIIGDVNDITRRQKFFGENNRSLPTVRSFWAVLKDQFDELYIQVLLVFATISLVVGIFSKDKKLIEALSIYFAVIFAGLIQTFCDWGKERQFLRLRAEIMNEKATVLRGQYGTSSTVYVKDLVVGDIVLMEQGDRVPADCLLIEEMDMRVDQKQFYPDVEGFEATMKQCSYCDHEQDKRENPDPVLLQDSIVMTGFGKAVVLAVGEHTMKEQEIRENLQGEKNILQVEKSETPFQAKLRILSEIVGTYAYTTCVVSLFIFALVWLILVITSDYKLVESWSILKALELAQTAIALLIVCIPEGMPLVISMAMAFSVDQLKNERLLIKNLSALETSGQLVDILTGKTATLTTGDMQVARLNMIDETFVADQINCNLEVQQRLWDCVIMNCSAHMQMIGDEYRPVGSPVEVGLLQLLCDNGVPVQERLIERERDHGMQLWIPFSSERKRMTVAYTLKDYPEIVRLVVKGAPEEIVPMCTSKLGSLMKLDVFNGQGQDGKDYLQNVVVNDLIIGPNPATHTDIQVKGAPTGLKPITIAYRDFYANEFIATKKSEQNFESEDSRTIIENDLTLIASFGLEDPMRNGISEALDQLQQSTNVRIISGDHMMSVQSSAIQMGLMSHLNETEFVRSSDQLEEMLRPLMQESIDKEEGRGKSYEFKDRQCRKRFNENVKSQVVMVYRATPKVKHMFTCALRQSGSTIGVTGEGLSDSRALSEASVGFTMGQDGCAAAKDHADIILTDDNFFTVIAAIRWGRNIQDNVRKFIQFQMTVNCSCMTFVLFTTIVLGHPPFTVVQLLWINLIMDVLAAIAFATENPHPTEIRKDRVRMRDRIITPTMMRSILSQTIYQVVVMLILLFAGPGAAGYSYSLYTTELAVDGTPTYRMLHQTFMFQCFVMMNIFNMVNCRVLDQMPVDINIEESSLLDEGMNRQGSRREFNIFRRPFQNLWFWIVLLTELNVQFLMVGYSGFFATLFRSTPMTFGMHMAAVGLGIGSWVLAAIMKFTGKKLLNCMPEFGEDRKALEQAKARTDAAKGALTFTYKDDEKDKNVVAGATTTTPEGPASSAYEETDLDISRLDSMTTPSRSM